MFGYSIHAITVYGKSQLNIYLSVYFKLTEWLKSGADFNDFFSGFPEIPP